MRRQVNKTRKTIEIKYIDYHPLCSSDGSSHIYTGTTQESDQEIIDKNIKDDNELTNIMEVNGKKHLFFYHKSNYRTVITLIVISEMETKNA